MSGVMTRRHSSVKRFRELARAPGGNTRDREVLLDGVHLLSEAQSSGMTIDTAAFEQAALDRQETRALAERLASTGTHVLIVSRAVLEAMSPVKTPSGAVGIASCRMLTLAEVLDDSRHSSRVVVLAYDVQDPGNVGALIRTAEATGAAALVACGATADPLGWKALRGSMGSALRLAVARAEIQDAISGCQKAGFRVAALAPRGGEPLFRSNLLPPVALLVGSEGAGLSIPLLEQADARVSIPMRPPVESLNVAVAAGLVLYEALRQRGHESV